MSRAGLNIDNNYCHNAFGWGTEPWCFFKSSNSLVQDWGYCDIPPCQRSCQKPATTISSTAYMTSTVSTKPARHSPKRRDPFVTCWNKCYQIGPVNGLQCMNDCIKVSYKLIVLNKLPFFLRIRSPEIKLSIIFRNFSNQNVQHFSRRFFFAIQGKAKKQNPSMTPR